ncbi:MAG: hypothetical protein K0U54_12190, partial [Bacteroidetes bacterium]|nr:hypothetical protein [Bacteroidota bacterium]
MKKIILGVCLLIFVGASYAQADDPDSAVPLTVGAFFEANPVIGNNFGATGSEIADPSIPAPGCGGYQGADVWFNFIVPASGAVEVRTRLEPTPVIDTAIAIYSGSIGAFSLVACNDDGGGGLSSLINLVGQTPGTLLYVRVWDFGTPNMGNFTISAYNCDVDAAAIEITGTGETMTSICVDGTGDPIDVSVVGDGVGENSGWVITDNSTGEILGLPPGPPFDLDGAGVGVCDIWYIRYATGTTGIAAGNNVSDIVGCFDLSNPVTVYRTEPADAAAIEITGTGETMTSICVDGTGDPIDVSVVGDGVGENSGWVITDNSTGEILGLPPGPPFDLDGAGVGVCDIWYIRYATGTTGIAAGNNVSDIVGCFDLSNPVTVYRTEPADAAAIEITGTGETMTSICVDGTGDPIDVSVVGDGVGENSGWVITDNSTG